MLDAYILLLIVLHKQIYECIDVKMLSFAGKLFGRKINKLQIIMVIGVLYVPGNLCAKYSLHES